VVKQTQLRLKGKQLLIVALSLIEFGIRIEEGYTFLSGGIFHGSRGVTQNLIIKKQSY